MRLKAESLNVIDSWQLVNGFGDSDFGGSPTIFSATLDSVPTTMVGACNKDGFYYAWRLDDLHDGPVWKTQIGLHGRRAEGGICIAGAVWDGANLYIGGPPTDIGDTFYRGSMRKLDPATGVPVWETPLPTAVMTDASMDGAGAIAVSSFDSSDAVTNSTFLFDAATGTYVAVDNGGVRSAASPVFADDYLIIANGVGSIYAYQVTAPRRRSRTTQRPSSCMSRARSPGSMSRPRASSIARGLILRRGLLDDVGELGRIDPRGQIVQLGLDEHEAQGVLEHLHLRITAEVALADELLHAGDGRGVVADGFEDLRDLARVLVVQRAPPPEVARASFRVRRARDGPTPQVVRPRREQERVARLRARGGAPSR